MSALRWHRSGAGEWADESGEFTISRHEVDDREYDGGYHVVQWHISQNGSPFEIEPRLGDAKATCQRIVDRRAGVVTTGEARTENGEQRLATPARAVEIAAYKGDAVTALEIEHETYLERHYGPQWGEQNERAFAAIERRLTRAYDQAGITGYDRKAGL